MQLCEQVPLAPRTTLGLGGAARRLVHIVDEEELATFMRDASRDQIPIFVLGAGSNLVVADEGFDGTVVTLGMSEIVCETNQDAIQETIQDPSGDESTRTICHVGAGTTWDAFVERVVSERLVGVEALSGIPGLVGAAPIQNIGAYGQEVKDTIASVRAYDRVERRFVDLGPSECAFRYRMSAFKAAPSRYVVTRVSFVFSHAARSANGERGERGKGTVRYAELARALGVAEGASADIGAIRDAVIELRRAKGMVSDDNDPDSVSAGSFFVNPIVTMEEARRVEQTARALGLLGAAGGDRFPMFRAEDGLCKLSAGWLVERAGFYKGYGDGRVGVSRKHALALVHRGGGTTRELLELARVVQRGVREKFGIALSAEPVMLGCSL